MAQQVNDEEVELARSSLEGMSDRVSSSTASRSTEPEGSMAPSAAAKFGEVAWEEPPEGEADEPEASEVANRAAPEVESSGLAATASEKFRAVAWEEPPDEPRATDETSDWAEDMKLSNFFEDAGW